MTYREELVQLAHLLRVGAQAARGVFVPYPRDSEEVRSLAGEADRIADRLDVIAGRGKNDP